MSGYYRYFREHRSAIDGFPDEGGIYGIRNRATGRMYVGQTASIRPRLLAHLSNLRGRRHIKLKLQMDWDNYGPDAFDWLVLELLPDCPKWLRRDIECKHIAIHQADQPWSGYNYCPPENWHVSMVGPRSDLLRRLRWLELAP